MNESHMERLAALERSVRKMRVFVVLSAILIVALGSTAFLNTRATPSVLTVPELKITDANGVVRVHIAGAVPGAKRGQSGEGAAGLLLFDATGVERGGYITTDSSGYIGLTLDARKVNSTTGSTQTAVFRADSAGATTLRLWNGGNAFEIRADSEGARYSVLRDRQVILQAPEVADPVASRVCTDLRGLQAQYDAASIRRACRERMTEAACTLCLGRQ